MEDDNKYHNYVIFRFIQYILYNRDIFYAIENVENEADVKKITQAKMCIINAMLMMEIYINSITPHVCTSLTNTYTKILMELKKNKSRNERDLISVFCVNCDNSTRRLHPLIDPHLCCDCFKTMTEPDMIELSKQQLHMTTTFLNHREV